MAYFKNICIFKKIVLGDLCMVLFKVPRYDVNIQTASATTY